VSADEGEDRVAAPLAATYGSFLGALGVYGPFLASYLEDSRGLSPSTAAYLLALMPITGAVATPVWTLVADRLGSAVRVLRLVASGALLAFLALLVPRTGLVFVAGTLVLFSALRAPGTALIDVVALDWVARRGGQFGRIRSAGTIGFTVGAVATSLVVSRFGASSMLLVGAAVLSLTVFAVHRLPPVGGAPRAEAARLLPALGLLLRRRRFALFLVTAVLHQVGLGPYDSLFPARLTQLAGAEFAGAAIALGTASELVVMLLAARLIRRLGLARTLGLAYAGSAGRWFILSVAVSRWPLTLAQVFHGLTYGAFYASAVALVDAEAPRDVRASAQGIFSMVTWGLASSAAIAFAGALQRIAGMSLVFSVATGASVLAAVLSWWLGPSRAEPPAGG
jgi:PPP family 3-phenylpropionic acid transporter